MKTLEELQGTIEDQVDRMSKYELTKQDYVFGIALSASVLMSMLKSFSETSNTETPDFVQNLFIDLEAVMVAMARNSGEAHIKTGVVKSRMLLEEVARIVKTPSTVQ